MAGGDDRARNGRSKVWFAREFELSIPTVAKRIHDAGIKPIGHVRKKPVYRVRDVAPVLLPPVVQVLTSAADGDEQPSIDPDKLPPDLADKYWAAQLKKLKHTELAGDLWPTEQVIEVLGGAAKMIRQSVMLFVDAVERETGLSATQRKIIVQRSDDLLVGIQKALIDEVDPDASSEAEPEGDDEDAVPEPAADPPARRGNNKAARTNKRKRSRGALPPPA